MIKNRKLVITYEEGWGLRDGFQKFRRGNTCQPYRYFFFCALFFCGVWGAGGAGGGPLEPPLNPPMGFSSH